MIFQYISIYFNDIDPCFDPLFYPTGFTISLCLSSLFHKGGHCDWAHAVCEARSSRSHPSVASLCFPPSLTVPGRNDHAACTGLRPRGMDEKMVSQVAWKFRGAMKSSGAFMGGAMGGQRIVETDSDLGLISYDM